MLSFDRAKTYFRYFSEVATDAELADLLDELTREMGFAYFALTHHVDIRRNPDRAIRLLNYPGEWVEYYDAHSLGVSDPVHRASHVTNLAFAWSKIPELIALSPRDHDILAMGGHNGVGDGFTVPAHIPGESHGSCTFANPVDVPLPEDQLPMAQLIGQYAFHTARRLWQVRPSEPVATLTERQKECVVWVAAGKTDWEILRPGAHPAGWLPCISRPLAVKGGGACASMFSTPGLTAGRLAARGDHASKPGSIVLRDARRSHAMVPLSSRSAVDRDDTGRGEQAAPLAAGYDPARLERLYRQEAGGLARIIARRTGDPELARDVVHDAFVRIAGRPGALALLDRPQAYLRRIAANLIRDRSRVDARRSARLHVAAEDDVLPAGEPHALLEARDMQRRVEAALVRLPDRTREIFMAHRVEGLTYAEIAERTGLTVKGVEKQMSKALARLDRLVARD